MPFAATVPVATEAMATDFLGLLLCAAGLTLVLRAVQFATAMQTADLTDLLGKVRIDFFQKQM